VALRAFALGQTVGDEGGHRGPRGLGTLDTSLVTRASSARQEKTRPMRLDAFVIRQGRRDRRDRNENTGSGSTFTSRLPSSFSHHCAARRIEIQPSSGQGHMRSKAALPRAGFSAAASARGSCFELGFIARQLDLRASPQSDASTLRTRQSSRPKRKEVGRHMPNDRAKACRSCARRRSAPCPWIPFCARLWGRTD